MFENTGFGRTTGILEMTMDAALVRRGVIANNIANAETPNFKRSDVGFEAELNRAILSENPTGLQGHMSHERHIPFHKEIDYRTVKPRITLDYLTQAKNNGNNVDIEQEMMQATQNQMMYETMSLAVSHQFRQINNALK
jgi:flagellar basal-body rod protein FlgB